MSQALEILRNVFGYREFRGNQAQVTEHLIKGCDAFVLMPTAAASRYASRFRPLPDPVWVLWSPINRLDARPG